MIKLKGLLKESFGLGELPSSKLMKMKMTLAELMASEESVTEAYDGPMTIRHDGAKLKVGAKIKVEDEKGKSQLAKVVKYSGNGIYIVKPIKESSVNEGQIADYQIGLKKVTKDDALEHMYGVDRPGKKWKQGMSVSTTAELKKLVKKYGNDNVVIHGKQNNGKPLVDILEGALTRK